MTVACRFLQAGTLYCVNVCRLRRKRGWPVVPKTPIVSIIMPVYNVESYVARAIESIQRQTLGSWELLVVDDGSTDGTGAVCDRMAARDWRIEVIHTPNSGAAAARNTALAKARGKYVHFLDGDDWVEPDMLADEVALAEEHELELVIAGFYIETYYNDAGEHTTEAKRHDAVIYDSQAAFRKHAYELFDENLLYTPWNKLFLRERIELLGIRFRPTFWDDFPFVLDYIRDVEKVGVIDKCYYHFIRQREESETSRWRPDMYAKREEEHGWMLDLYEHWGLADDPASSEMVQRRYIERLVGCLENVCNPACTVSPAENRAQIQELITSENARLAVRKAEPRSTMMRLMLWPVAIRSAGLAYAEGVVISLVKRNSTKMFATLKANR
jgi:glycosyltransferase EpsJ